MAKSKAPKNKTKSKQLQWRSIIKRGVVILLAVFLLVSLNLVVWYQIKHADEPTEMGVSFSTKYAHEMGIDWQAAFRYTVDDLDFRYLRLMSYWDQIEPEDDHFDFADLDWQMDEAAKRGVKVNLAVGERQPRWPECHHPYWIGGYSIEDFNGELYEFIATVVNRYKHHPALEEYQLENEIFNNLFGECRRVDRDRVQAEYDLIKSLDPINPVVINVSNQSGTPVREPVGDKVGFSMYRKAFGQFGPIDWYFNFWFAPPYWHTLRAAVIELMHGADTFVHELQTEPWGPGPTVALSIEEQDITMTPDIIRQQVRFAEQTGMNRIYLWGTEWWYWRETVHNDPSLSDTVRELVKERNAKL